MKTKFTVEDIVYYKIDREQLPRMVTAITLTKAGILYSLSYCGELAQAYEFEITTEKDLTVQFGNN